ncbi:MAG: hypothetical protein CBE33_04075 [Candidatus Pelagibacter sp. TMED273]|nr:MAG: hypothetical protein CBE33_04075 [Candidatus Pelagibacter sp. TMED273]|tara:strand:+ start:779 stop:2506 length:1728 start_codon:yes stop_codon:yes gene_type:complete
MENEKSIIKKIFLILTKKEKNYYYLYLLFLLIASIFQILGIGSIIPLTSIFLNNETDSQLVQHLRDIFNLSNEYNNFEIILVFTTITIILSNIIFLLSAYLSTKINFRVEQNVRERLFKYYIKGNFSDFFKTDTSLLMNLIITETQRFSGQVLMPLADIISRLVVLLFMIVLLLFLVPFKALISIGALILFYIFLFNIIKGKITANNKAFTEKNKNLIKTTSDIFKSFREIKIYGLESKFLSQIINTVKAIQKIKFFSVFIAVSPRFFLEILIFLIIFFYFITIGDFSNNQQLSLLAMLGYSFFKILPTLQGIFTQTVVYNSHKNSVNEIYSKLTSIQENYTDSENIFKNYQNGNFQNIKSIKLKNISFNYDKKEIFKNIDLEINKGEKIGLVGPTGTGKSTLINIILGILKPDSGSVFINDTKINEKNLLNEIKNLVAIIPQSASLLEDTILNNIILGDKFDKEKFNDVLKKSHVDDFVNSKNNSPNDQIHGSGLNLSGGQLQRILIARALYKEPRILIIDEGFNQLDNATEEKILKNILSIKDLIIIVVYHNFMKKEILDKVYSIKNSKLLKI